MNVSAAAASAVIPMLDDLPGDAVRARETGKPIIILFSLPGCPFCHVVRQHYLIPLLRDRKPQDQPVLREVDITSAHSVKGFDNAVTSHLAIAKVFNIRIAPTVVFLDAEGQLLSNAIVGGDTTGLYGGYLDRALEDAERKLRARQLDDKRGRP
jgi:hypothetical protein